MINCWVIVTGCLIHNCDPCLKFREHSDEGRLPGAQEGCGRYGGRNQ